MNILITTSSFGKEDKEPLILLQNQGYNVQLNPFGRQLTIEESKSLLPKMDGIIAGTEKLNQESLSSANDLRYIVRLGTGMDNVDFHTTNMKNIVVENTPNAHVDGVAELALSGILNSLRGISFSDRKIRQGEWAKPMGALLRGKSIGLIGMGKIAKRLIQLLQPFDCSILAYDPFFDEQFAQEFKVKNSSLDEIYRLSDIISLHLPYSNENKNVIDSIALAKMKKDVLIVNTSRGGLINEVELFQFLTENKNAKAYLDTFETEPYNGELKNLDNILMTGHIGTYAKEVRKIMELEAAQKLINYFQQHGK